jgi:uncharacterized protein (DUF488 family)
MSKSKIKLFTIGFTRKSAETFFELLIQNQVQRIVDVRLNNVSQLAGFAKRQDLAYFLEKIAHIDYVHQLNLAPTKDILDSYKKQKGDWETYETQFLKLMQARKIEEALAPDLLDGGCLLCSEAKPHYCHRRLVAEYLKERWGNLEIHHL